MDLCDESSEIRATLWRDAAVRFHEMIETGKVYLISRGQLRMANKKFSISNNQYEMSLGVDSRIQLCSGEPGVLMPTVRYNFVPIASIAQKPTNATIDVVGVTNEISQITRLTSKAGRELVTRTLSICDDSGAAIELTIWGKDAVAFPDSGTHVVAFKGMRVTDWNQKSLSFGMGSLLESEPATLEATERLRSWWGDGSHVSMRSLSVQGVGRMGGGSPRDETSRELITDLKDRQLSSGPHYANLRVAIAKLNLTRNDAPIWYPSCPKCTRKVIEGAENHCENCGWNGSSCDYRYVLPMIVEDASGSSWVSAFNDQATQILGMPASELKALKDQRSQMYEQILANAERKNYVMRGRAKLDSWQGQDRIKVQARSLQPINFVTEIKLLVSDISKYNKSDIRETEFSPTAIIQTVLGSEAKDAIESKPGFAESVSATGSFSHTRMAEVPEVKSETFPQFDHE